MSSSAELLRVFRHFLRRGQLRAVGTQIIAVAVVFLLAAMLLLSVNVTRLQESFDWVQRSDDVLLQLSEVEARLIGNELTLRGYALTDDPRFVLYHEHEDQVMWAAMHRLQVTVGDEPEHKERYARLHAVLTKRSQAVLQLFALGPGHDRDVAAAIIDKQYRNVLFEARAKIADFRADELRVLAERQSATARQARHTYAVAFTIVMFAFVFGALGIAFIQFGRGTAP